MGDHRGQLQDVAGPVASQQTLPRFLGKIAGKRVPGRPRLGDGRVQEVVGQRPDILLAMPQRRNVDADGVQIVVEPGVETVLPTAVSRSHVVDAITRNCVGTRALSSRPWPLLSCKASSNLVWAHAGSCATPSRKSVPHRPDSKPNSPTGGPRRRQRHRRTLRTTSSPVPTPAASHRRSHEGPGGIPALAVNFASDRRLSHADLAVEQHGDGGRGNLTHTIEDLASPDCGR